RRRLRPLAELRLILRRRRLDHLGAGRLARLLGHDGLVALAATQQPEAAESEKPKAQTTGEPIHENSRIPRSTGQGSRSMPTTRHAARGDELNESTSRRRNASKSDTITDDGNQQAEHRLPVFLSSTLLGNDGLSRARLGQGEERSRPG